MGYLLWVIWFLQICSCNEMHSNTKNTNMTPAAKRLPNIWLTKILAPCQVFAYVVCALNLQHDRMYH